MVDGFDDPSQRKAHTAHADGCHEPVVRARRSLGDGLLPRRDLVRGVVLGADGVEAAETRQHRDRSGGSVVDVAEALVRRSKCVMDLDGSVAPAHGEAVGDPDEDLDLVTAPLARRREGLGEHESAP